jgi:transglutaminase-like putative cysteine protease
MTRGTRSPDYDQRIADWFEHDPDLAPRIVLPTVLAALPTVEQRSGNAGRPGRRVVRFLSIAAATTAVVVAAVSGTFPPAGQPSATNDPLPVSATLPFVSTWVTDNAVALTIQGESLDGHELWRAATYDRITASGWEQSDVRAESRAANVPLLLDTVERAGGAPLFRSVTVDVFPGPRAPRPLVSPGTPVTIDVPVRLSLIGDPGFVGSITPDGPPIPMYRVTSSVLVRGTDVDDPHAATLRTAGTLYPAAVLDRYLEVPAGALGPNASALRDRILAASATRAPFDIAQEAEAVFRSSEFTYDVDIRDQHCGGASIAECFATYRRGFCIQYATTMAAILRDLGIPTRLVEGFRPGTLAGGVEVVRVPQASAWVEVYFPEYGWVAFDPTGGSQPDRVAPSS